jgi:nucleotide-binding universal stress UspA family protein
MNDEPILIAYDGSDPARRAVREAGKLFGPRQALVVTVWEPALVLPTDPLPVPGADPLSVSGLVPPVVDPAAVQRLDQDVEAGAHRIAESGAELARSVGLQAEALATDDEGQVARAIVEVARTREAAAIVVGSRGLTGLRARLEGSTSDAVLKHSPCPVVVVHDD